MFAGLSPQYSFETNEKNLATSTPAKYPLAISPMFNTATKRRCEVSVSSGKNKISTYHVTTRVILCLVHIVRKMYHMKPYGIHPETLIWFWEVCENDWKFALELLTSKSTRSSPSCSFSCHSSDRATNPRRCIIWFYYVLLKSEPNSHPKSELSTNPFIKKLKKVAAHQKTSVSNLLEGPRVGISKQPKNPIRILRTEMRSSRMLRKRLRSKIQVFDLWVMLVIDQPFKNWQVPTKSAFR